MIKRKIFFSVADEREFLNKMNSEGYELVKASPFTYVFEKTDREVNYQHIPIKNGRRGFSALDYKTRDSDAKAVYLKNDIALFKKPSDKGGFSILPQSEIELRLAKRRTKQNNLAVCFIALGVLLATLGSRAKAGYVVCLSVIVLIYAFVMMINSRKK